MTGERRKFRHQGEERRRDSLIWATLDLVADGGPGSATVRAIAAKAGVSQGLIRHYFVSKDDLTRAAYHALMTKMTDDNLAVLEATPAQPEVRLAAFIAGSLRAPSVDARAMGLWAGFMTEVRSDPAMRTVHEETYLRYRSLLETLIAALPTAKPAGGAIAPAMLRGLAIACTALVDGLWLEGCALPNGFAPDELARIGVRSIGAILGHDLERHMTAPVSLPSEPEKISA